MILNNYIYLIKLFIYSGLNTTIFEEQSNTLYDIIKLLSDDNSSPMQNSTILFSNLKILEYPSKFIFLSNTTKLCS